MVCHGPDPPDDSQNNVSFDPSRNIVVNAGNSSDESDNEMDYEGYQQLPQSLTEANLPQEASDSEQEDENESNSNADLPPIESISTELCKEVWSEQRKEDPINMDKEKVKQVLHVMSNIVLPQSAIPDWAKDIPEDQWKEELKERIEEIKNKR